MVLNLCQNMTNSGYGKVILFGEHFVVYGLPAIVTALDLVTTAQLEQQNTSDLVIIDNRPKVPTFKSRKYTEYQSMIRAIFIALGITPYGWRVTLQGTLPVSNGGIGASAAAAVAVARALNQKFNLGLTDDQINQAAFAGEQEVHGTPSGIDNTAATFGGTFVFRKNEAPVPGSSPGQALRDAHLRFAPQGNRVLFPMSLPNPSTNAGLPAMPAEAASCLRQGYGGLREGWEERARIAHASRRATTLHLVLADSGRPTNTKQVIAAVSAWRTQNTTAITHIFQQYHDLFTVAHAALATGNLSALGHAMTQNHRLLAQLGVSSPELDFLVHRAQQVGALGAKLTGTGCGGLIIALAAHANDQHHIAQRLAGNGFFTLTATVGHNNHQRHYPQAPHNQVIPFDEKRGTL